MTEFLDERVRNLSVIDMGLIKFAVFFTALIIVKLFPQLITIDFTILIFLAALCSAKPFYDFWYGKNVKKG